MPHEPNKQAAAMQVAAILLFIAVVFAFSFFQNTEEAHVIPYSEFKQNIVAGLYEEVRISEEMVEAVASGEVSTIVRAVLPPGGDPSLLPHLEAQSVEVTGIAPTSGNFLIGLVPWVFIIAFYIWFARRFSPSLPGQNRMQDLFGGRFTKPVQNDRPVTFRDVAGQDQAKQEVEELVEFLRDFERFDRVGAEVPHGVLLMGPPGTGKTLLAKALAGEANVPFFSTSGSEFIEVFVGVGAGRVRRMFEEARKQAPSVIFIDELDSIGRTRGTGLGGGNDEREQTLNQILAELDGFSGKDAVVVLAATNRPDVLDPALLRPGRFDRHVTLELPDQAAREAILKVHAKGRPLANDIDLKALSKSLPGFSGADLKNLLNEASIRAARREGGEITSEDLTEARDRITLGTVRTLAIMPEEKHRLAVHEAGHTAVAYYQPGADPVEKVTIIPRGRSLGGTHILPKEERHTLDQSYLETQLAILLAGQAAEIAWLKTASSGADDDINRATSLARSMISRWGMAEELGPINLTSEEDHPFLGQSIAQPKVFSDRTAAKVDECVIALLKKAQATATSVVEKHRDAIDRLISELEQRETLDASEISKILETGGNISRLPGTSTSHKTGHEFTSQTNKRT
ncbi:MAG: ATP-dependent zinc metalloprotease FtsH [Pseudomonadota bacterium]